MNINATLIGQFITFAILIWFTMRYVWPPITKAMHEREKKIAAGLLNAEQSKRELEMAEHKAFTLIRDAKHQATEIIEQASLQCTQLIESARKEAKHEGDRLLEMAQENIQHEVEKAKQMLKHNLASLVVLGAEKILKNKLDISAQHDLLNQLAEEI